MNGDEAVLDAIAPETVAEPSREAVTALLQRYNLPAVETLAAVPGSGGDAFVINGELLLRLDGDAQSPRLAKEALIYRRLRRSTDVPCPEVLAFDRARDLVPADAMILTVPRGIKGSEIWDELSVDAREAVSEEAGRMCGAIHTLHWTGYGDFNVATGTFGQYPRWTDLVLARVEHLTGKVLDGGMLPPALVYAALTQLNDGDSVLTAASLPRLTHGNMDADNLLLEEREGEWRIAAIMGWERALTADAGYEFATMSMRRPERKSLADTFVHGYRERHALQIDLRSRIHLYRVVLHLEGAITEPESRPRHEQALRRLVGRG